MSELKEKVQASIERLKAFEPRNGEGYYLAFSGGKDSVVCKALLDMAGVKYESTYRVTSVDPPELVQFIKNEHPDVKMEIPHYKNITYKDGRLMPITMWNLIPRKLVPPTRLVRYCCSELKESGGDGRMTVTGVRWAESVNRAKNQGKVTIVNAKKKDDVSNSPDFKQTNRGGRCACKRQRRQPENGGTVLQAQENNRKPHNRLVRPGGLGVYQGRIYPGLQAVRRGLEPSGVYRLSPCTEARQRKKVCPLADLQESVFDGVWENAGRENKERENRRQLENGNDSARRFQLVDGIRRFTGTNELV